MKFNVSTSKKVKTLLFFKADFKINSRLTLKFNSLEHPEPLKVMNNSMNNTMELLLLPNSPCWEVKARRKRKVTALPRETNTDILPPNSTLSATTLLIKTDLFRELKSSVNKKAVKKKVFSWLPTGTDTTVVNAA